MAKSRIYSSLIFDDIESGDDCGLEIVEKDYLYGISKMGFEITNEDMAQKYGRKIGKYSLLSLKLLDEDDMKRTEYIEDVLAMVLCDYVKCSHGTILVVGLGNKDIYPDALGSETVDKLNITRSFSNDKVVLCGLSPGVLGVTGIESSDIVRGVVDMVKPNIIITIDSLCASSVARLCTSIQVHDAGVVPGEGVENSRASIDEESMDVKVVSIGVPMLVYAETILREKFDELEIKRGECGEKGDKLLDYVYNYPYKNMIVTVNDIQFQVESLSNIISNAINKMVKKLNGKQ